MPLWAGEECTLLTTRETKRNTHSAAATSASASEGTGHQTFCQVRASGQRLSPAGLSLERPHGSRLLDLRSAAAVQPRSSRGTPSAGSAGSRCGRAPWPTQDARRHPSTRPGARESPELSAALPGCGVGRSEREETPLRPARGCALRSPEIPLPAAHATRPLTREGVWRRGPPWGSRSGSAPEGREAGSARAFAPQNLESGRSWEPAPRPAVPTPSRGERGAQGVPVLRTVRSRAPGALAQPGAGGDRLPRFAPAARP